ncbi:MAG: hypothetical protein U1C51_10230, partial [Candidatus Izemoplasmatales bacterium]|nr:hypothetical protein [Candidatus Izemoplasmatales bacterium]
TLFVDDVGYIFDKGNPSDKSIFIGGSPLPITSVKHGQYLLKASEYTVSLPDSVVVIHLSYLEQLPYGNATFEIVNSISSAVATIEIDDTRFAQKITLENSYTRSSLTDVLIQFQMYRRSFDGLLFDGQVVSNEHYSFANGLLTIKGSYLESLNEVEDEFEFIFLSEPDIEIIISIVIEEVLPVIVSVDAFYVDYLFDVVVNLDLKGLVFHGVQMGLEELVENVDYLFNVSEQTITLFKETLLKKVRFGQTSGSFTLLAGNNQQVGFVVPYPNLANRIWNGGFESGDLYGFNPYMIWKNEVGMASMQNGRVVNSTYFNQYPYHVDGEYNLGIVWANAPWDQSSERMGHLVSSPFLLGGSGWISFKLGGGYNPSFSYISVRKTSDHSEVARFGNTNFNNTSIASSEFGSTIINAEAFMFQYYVNLGQIVELGTSLYLTITESSSFDFAILSVDSLFTYYEQAPSTLHGTIATNIQPTILHIESASNEIKNGYFDHGLTDWSQQGNAWFVQDGIAKSNAFGDSSMGVLRSSAFVVTDMKYIRLDWAGGLAFDKQIFISIKEVGTNIEVLRFVVRANLSSKQSTNFDNHMLDLSSLSSELKYYMEFGDNRSGSWGVSFVDSIRFVSQAEWNQVVSTDRAVSIGPLTTVFQYQNPYPE